MGVTESKTSPRHLRLFEAAKENYQDDAADKSFVFRYTRAPNECPAIYSQHCQPVSPPVDKFPIEKTGEAPV